MFLRVIGKGLNKGGGAEELVGPFTSTGHMEGWLERNGFIPARKTGTYTTNANAFINVRLGEDAFRSSPLQAEAWALVVEARDPDEVQVIVRSVA